MNDTMDVSYQMSRQKIIFTGDVAVGKTSIINSLMGQKFNSEYDPSIGVDFFSKTIRYKGKLIKLQIWDSAGQEKFKSLIPNYIRGSSLVFLVYDITNKKTFEHLPAWVDFINNIENSNIVIVGNKVDLKDNREVQTEEGQEFCDENNFEFFEVSAKEDTNLNNMLFNSVASLPFFNTINVEGLTKEKIVDNLQQENLDSSRYQNSKNFNDQSGLKITNNINTNPNTNNSNTINLKEINQTQSEENKNNVNNIELLNEGEKTKKKCC